MNKFEKILLTLFFIELFVGGGGRLIDFGILSIRQALFFLLILTYAVRIFKEKAIFNKNINTFFRFTPVTIGIYILIIWFVISSLVGIMHHHPTGAVVTDFLRVVFFVVYFPLAYYVSKERYQVERIINILKYSALAVSFFTIIITLLGKTVFISNFYVFYNFMNSIMNDDLFFRPSNSVFYKSQFFVLIGLVISLNDLLNIKYSKIDIAIIIFGSISLIWSETRGFLLSFMLSVLMILILEVKVIVDPIKGLSQKIKSLIKSRSFIKKIVILLIILLAVPSLYNYMTLARFQTAKVEEIPQAKAEVKQDKKVKEKVNDESVNARVKFISASKAILIHPTNLILGTGYGTTIAGRITGIEMSFLDILVEQGLIGLTLWVFLFFLVYYNFYKAYKKGLKLSALDISLMSAFMGILLLTNINPFINNPIGISFFILLLVVSQNRKESAPKGEI